MKTLYFLIVPVLLGIVGILSIFVLGVNIFMYKQGIYDAIAATFEWLGLVTGFVSAVTFTFIALVTIIQVAISDMRGEAFDAVDRPRIWSRFFLSAFALALVPVAFTATNLRMVAQKYQDAGFVSEGSVVYLIAILFLAFACLLWRAAGDRNIIT